MNPIAIVAVGAESALGSGRDAYRVGEIGDPAVTAITEDATLRTVGLRKPFLARARVESKDGIDPARTLLARAAGALAADLDEHFPGWRTRSLGSVIGTSSGAMASLTEALRIRADGAALSASAARSTPYFAPLVELDTAFGRARERVQVLAACASSAIALGLACRWLDLGLVDLVIAGGYDAVTPFVASGFESLGATSSDRPRPFRVGRDGMALGEAAVLCALVRAEDAPSAPLGYLRGFAATSDAAHVTAPDRDGAGLARAARAALADANLDAASVSLLSAHATATPFNDSAESRALAALFEGHLEKVVVHPFKAIVGHTLGASAALELVAALSAMRRGVLPAAAGSGTVDSEHALRLLSRNESGKADTCLKLSAAFGGANASLVATSRPGIGRRPERRRVEILAVGDPVSEVDVERLGRVTRIPGVHLARLDPLSGLAIGAAHSAVARVPDLPKARTGVVVGSSAATIENNEAFDRKLRERGPRAVEPRRFPATSPNLAAGQVTIALGLLGPSLSVGAGLAAALEALLVAHDLVATGDADAMVVIAAEDVAEAVRSLWTTAGWPVPAHGALAAVVAPASSKGIERDALASANDDATGSLGSLGDAKPGWPTLRAAIERLRSAY